MPVFKLSDELIFPPTELAEEDGLLAVGGDLSPERLVEAYRQGIFPWFSQGDPILWWFTSPRLVIFPDTFKPSKRLKRYYKKPLFRITMDTVFEEVISSCASIRQQSGEETWITDEMTDAYVSLHKLGFAHSVECWDDDKLVGGLYGIGLDKVFFGESMFSRKSNASKIALVALVNYLLEREYKIIDCQMTTDHLLRMGGEEISGKSFATYLEHNINHITPDGAWKNDCKKDH